MMSNDRKVVRKYISFLTKIFQILLLTQMMSNCLRILPQKKKKNCLRIFLEVSHRKAAQTTKLLAKILASLWTILSLMCSNLYYFIKLYIKIRIEIVDVLENKLVKFWHWLQQR